MIREWENTSFYLCCICPLRNPITCNVTQASIKSRSFQTACFCFMCYVSVKQNISSVLFLNLHKSSTNQADCFGVVWKLLGCWAMSHHKKRSLRKMYKHCTYANGVYGTIRNTFVFRPHGVQNYGEFSVRKYCLNDVLYFCWSSFGFIPVWMLCTVFILLTKFYNLSSISFFLSNFVDKRNIVFK